MKCALRKHTMLPPLHFLFLWLVPYVTEAAGGGGRPKPKIELFGQAVVTVPVDTHQEYEDPGAACEDAKDGDMCVLLSLLVVFCLLLSVT